MNDLPEHLSIYKYRITWKELKKYHKNPPKKSLPKSLINYNKYQNHLKLIKKYLPIMIFIF